MRCLRSCRWLYVLVMVSCWAMRSLLRCVDGDSMSRIDPFDAIQGPLGMMTRARLEVMARLLLVASGGMVLLWLISPNAYHRCDQPRAALRNTREQSASRVIRVMECCVRFEEVELISSYNTKCNNTAVQNTKERNTF
ncbi:hypothetical protein E2C01_072756 [Portunus trituberculatus]|uniref:Uncharacterized protein n=1 Tax=Portunus trituberculatus TaxID=210409 RepID=A0A5B7HYW7_PORTR|nr:hypothetical protein [Portunus trituberculatus]